MQNQRGLNGALVAKGFEHNQAPRRALNYFSGPIRPDIKGKRVTNPPPWAMGGGAGLQTSVVPHRGINCRKNIWTTNRCFFFRASRIQPGALFSNF